MHPVFEFCVGDAPVKGVGGQHEDEVPGIADTVQQVIIKLPRSQLLNVEKHGEATHLQVYLEQTGGRRQNRSLLLVTHDVFSFGLTNTLT